MNITEVKEQVLIANQQLETTGLVKLTWGNVSGIDREQGLVVIKPSGVPYSQLSIEQLVVLDLEGNKVEGTLKPSSDTPTHLALYRAFSEIGGIVHTHSMYATMFAQAGREIPCLGTTHADHFSGTIPLARHLTRKEVEEDYEANTGKCIIERFEKINPMEIPGVLLHQHAPFTWGKTPQEALINSQVLEAVAEMAWGTYLLNAATKEIPNHIMNKHYTRKHGPDAYYGQK